MAALPAFRLNMIAKVIDCTTGNEIAQKEWSNVFTNNTPVTVLFDDRTSFIAVSGEVVYTRDVLAAVYTSFQDYVHTVKEIRAVRNLEKELRKKLAGFNYKPKTLGDLLLAVGVDLKASSEAALQDQKGSTISTVDMSTLTIGDVVVRRDGVCVCVNKISIIAGRTPFCINDTTSYCKQGYFYSRYNNHPLDIVQINKVGNK